MNLKLYSHNGGILLLTMIFMVSLVAFASIFAGTVMFTNANAITQTNNMKALYIAEAGLNKAIYNLKNNNAWRTVTYVSGGTPNVPPAACADPDPCAEEINGGVYTVWVEDSNGVIQITSKGVFSGSTRIVRANVNSTASAIVENSWTEI